MYPFPEEHWINQPIESENCHTLLQMCVSQPKPEFTKLLIRAGARADQYNDMLDMAAIHSAILGGHGEQHLIALLENDRQVKCFLYFILQLIFFLSGIDPLSTPACSQMERLLFI